VTARAPLLVLGIGNELFTDEGIGPAAARKVTELGLPGVDVLDGGTLGLSLLPELEGRRGVLFIDAMAARGFSPGAILELDATDLDQPFQMCYSAHQLGLTETLQAARLVGTAPALVAAVGMVPYSLETGYGLSPQAIQRLDAVVDTAQVILRRWILEMEMAHA
jgi:hydrogenase maturation protease